MRRLGTFPDPDGLSQLLLRLTVSSTVYCLSEMTSPWGFKVAARSSPAFHLLTSGSAWLEIDGEEQHVRLSAGDLVILPRGEGHAVRDSPKSPVLWLDRILADPPPVNGHLAHGGGGERAELLCGGFAVDQLTGRPLLEALPTVVHLRGSEGRAPEWLVGLIRMIALEMASNGPGSEADRRAARSGAPAVLDRRGPGGRRVKPDQRSTDRTGPASNQGAPRQAVDGAEDGCCCRTLAIRIRGAIPRRHR